jgi:hypothetical protein
VDSKKGYWQRQLYFLSSLGLFYIILIALFAIPLVGAFVVILIQGAFDLRYVIIAAGCLGMVVLGFVAFNVVRRLWRRFQRDGLAVGEDARRSLLMGKPVEITIFNGLMKFTCGHEKSSSLPAIEHVKQNLLPHDTRPSSVTDILDRLQHLSELKQTGAIDEEEFNLLKAMLLDDPSCSGGTIKRERSRSE